MAEKTKTHKVRNLHALNAILNRPAGKFADRKKAASRKACRGRIRPD